MGAIVHKLSLSRVHSFRLLLRAYGLILAPTKYSSAHRVRLGWQGGNMRIANTLARAAAALLVTVLLNGAVIFAFDSVAAHGATARSASTSPCLI
jgi:hypothetical protein